MRIYDTSRISREKRQIIIQRLRPTIERTAEKLRQAESKAESAGDQGLKELWSSNREQSERLIKMIEEGEVLDLNWFYEPVCNRAARIFCEVLREKAS